jgi:nitronate monooxygenase
MAGGPSTPALVAAVGAAGGIGFLGAGYVTPERLSDDISAVRGTSRRPFGVNVFVGEVPPAARVGLAAYVEEVRLAATRLEVEPGVPRFDDDHFDAKVDVLCADPVDVVSFTFGVPSTETMRRLEAAGSEIWLTVTSPEEALAAAAQQPAAIIVQGVEAGGHRGVFVDDDDASDLTLLSALQLIAPIVECPLVAAGGLVTGAAIAAVLVAGATAAQLGTAYLRCPEAGTSDVQRAATATTTRTVLTRAFSGRTARGIDNGFHRAHGATAPRAYPEVHHLTVPLRAHGRATGDADLVNLWAGQPHQLAEARPAGELTRALAEEARRAIERAARRITVDEGGAARPRREEA